MANISSVNIQRTLWFLFSNLLVLENVRNIEKVQNIEFALLRFEEFTSADAQILLGVVKVIFSVYLISKQ